ncbi:unnamed protein product [Darwinula stevensoni]|uniref:peptidylprolyl isomerase n=1 Tax=Darwinula stevensoni TaxID=69355 RepID=A0A7R8XEA7_9CRUS|nr:unnamed protein product [Darwinula stevensoni]CAG0893865.1 unnamed protein product [Darwinula stevensoni]
MLHNKARDQFDPLSVLTLRYIYHRFHIGKVIKAWDLGVATMKKGEIATLVCKPEYAYGESGSPPKIPPNATLVFEVELFDWKAEDLSPSKDDGILRRNLVKGEGYSTPNDGAAVEVHLLGKYDGRVFEERDVTFTVGEGCEHGILQGIEIAIKKFKKCEKSRVTLSSKFAFGEKGHSEYNIPPNAGPIEYEVTLKSFEKAKERWQLNDDEKVQESKLFKEKGTKYFKEGKLDLALAQYKKVTEYLEFSFSEVGEDASEEQKAKKKECEQISLAGHLNLALCYLKKEEFLLARDECDKALKLDAKNEKALFRKGQAYYGMKEHDAAKKEFQAVLEMDKENKAAAHQIMLCNQAIKMQKERDKKLYANMFERMSKLDSKVGDKSHKDSGLDVGPWNGEKEGAQESSVAQQQQAEVAT